MSVFLLTKEPYGLKAELSGKNLAQIELFGAQNFDLTKDGTLSITTAQEVKRYAKFDTFTKLHVIHKNKNFVDTVLSNNAILQDRIVTLNGNVRYFRSDGLSLKTQEAVYAMDTKILSSAVEFLLQNNRLDVQGESFVYRFNDGVLDALGIHAVIKDKTQ